MWKTTDRFVQQKRAKALENESKLKQASPLLLSTSYSSNKCTSSQVYIPNYNKPNPNLVGPPNTNGQPIKGEKQCESCDVSSIHFARLLE